jgi:hypothetical protein
MIYQLIGIDHFLRSIFEDGFDFLVGRDEIKLAHNELLFVWVVLGCGSVMIRFKILYWILR